MNDYEALLRRYGVSTPILPYAGIAEPTDTSATDYQSLLDKYNVDRAEYDAWLREYKRRQAAWNMYGPDYQGELLGAPTYTYAPEAEKPASVAPVTPVIVPPTVLPELGQGNGGSSSQPSQTTPGLTSKDLYGAPTTYGWSFDQAVQSVKDNPMGYTTLGLVSPLGALGKFSVAGLTENIPDASPGTIMGERAAGLTDEADAMAGFGMQAALDAADQSVAADRTAAGDPMSGFDTDSAGDFGGLTANEGPGAADSSHDADGNDGAYKTGGLVAMHRKYKDGGVIEGDRGLDLSKVTPEQLAYLQQEDPGALQRGIARFDRSQSPAPSEAANLLQLTAKYARAVPPQESVYGTELREARQVASHETDAFNRLIAQATEQKNEGPSRAEMYFKLAAAFGAPTKTGSFGESLANASGAMAEHQKDVRASNSADAARRLQLGMASQQARMDAAKTDVATLRQLTAKELEEQRTMAMELMKVQIAAGKPQSEAGKIAMDKGLRPGTPEYASFVDAYVTDKVESGKLFKEAMISVAQQGANVRQSAENRKVTEAGMLTPAEGKMVATEQTAQDAKAMLASNLEKAYQLNKKAMSGSGVSKVTGAVLGAVGYPSEQLKAEEQLTQLLTQASLDYASRLKPMSDADARLAQKLTGLLGTSPASRAAQIQALYEQSKAEIDQHKARIEDVRNRKNRTKSPEPVSVEGAE